MEAPQGTSVLVIDHHPVFLQMVVRFLDEQRPNGVVVVGAAFRADDALALAAARRPQVIMLGLNGDTPAALALIAPLRRLLPGVCIIATAQLGIDEYRQVALAAGVDSFLSTDTLHRDLLPSIASLTGGTASDMCV